MINEVQIKPLMLYEVEYEDGGAETFTADTMVRDEGEILFYRTGNLIRLYTPFAGVRVVVVTPVDQAEVPQ